MRALVDPATGELVEVADTDCLGLEPYDYRAAKATALQATRDYLALVREYERAIEAKSQAEGRYRRELAKAMLAAKAEYGATMAEAMAKGTEAVAAADEARIIAEGHVYAVIERMRLARDNRVSISQFTVWSRDLDKTGFLEQPTN